MTTNEPAVEQELLGCPFCGSSDIRFEIMCRNGDGCFICGKCECLGPGDMASKEDAAAAWNRRSSPISGDRQMGVEVTGLSHHSRAMLLNVLWHHQGGSSPVGQAIRSMLGIGQHDHLSDTQVDQAKWIDSLLSKAAASPPVAAQSVCPLCSGSKMISPLQTCICAQSNLGTTPAESCRPEVPAQGEVAELRRKYDELILAVGNKYPGESRHETALRYIRRAEEPKTGAAAQKETKE